MKNHRGQSVVEFSVLIVIVIGALLAMQVYVKRGIQGRWKSAVDDLGDQYDPRLVNSRINHTMISTTDTRIYTTPIRGGLYTSRKDTTNSLEQKSGYSHVSAPPSQ